MKSTGVFISLFCCLFVYLTQAETIVLQNGLNNYKGCSDTYLVMGSDSAFGSDTILEVEGYHCAMCTDQRALIKYDLSSLPSNATILKATVSLYSTEQPRPGESMVRVFKVSKAWDEASASWKKATNSSAWAKLGGDFGTTPDTTYNYGLDVNVWHSFEITNLVKDFYKKPTSNFGILLYMEAIMNTVDYASSNYTRQEFRPKLSIELSKTDIVSSNKTTLQPSHWASIRGRDITLSLIGKTNDLCACLYTVHGQLLMKISIAAPQTTFSVPTHVTAGTYMLTISGLTVQSAQKIILE